MAIHQNQSVQRCFSILQIVASEPGLGLAEISVRAELPKPTAYRFLVTLVEHGLLRVTDEKTYRLGYRLVELGTLAREQSSIREIALPFMADLRDTYNETCHLAVLESGHATYLEKVESTHALRHWTTVGQRMPLNAGAAALCLSAFLPRSELIALLAEEPLQKLTELTITDQDAFLERLDEYVEQGYVISSGAAYDGVTGIAMPIYDRQGAAVAALSIGGPSTRFPDELIDRMLPSLEHAARGISAALGHRAARAKLAELAER